ncbi:MAG: hypothetical protein RBR26_10180 [Methanosarcina mazei]|nr:hypothetical protein [Methanosarcina mazei]
MRNLVKNQYANLETLLQRSGSAEKHGIGMHKNPLMKKHVMHVHPDGIVKQPKENILADSHEFREEI